jgi:threonine/homoserine/homoserine lactone efflux protein
MPEYASFMTFIFAGLMLNITPGPDVLYIIGRSLGQGRMAGVVSALGIGVGCLFHVGAAAFGLTALIRASPQLYNAITLAGAAYLFWIGANKLFRPPAPPHSDTLEREPLGRIFLDGVITNVLNPKVALFILAFLPQFADTGRGPLAQQILLLGVIFDVNGVLVGIGYALIAGEFQRRFRSVAGGTWRLDRAVGVMFIAIAVWFAWSEHA